MQPIGLSLVQGIRDFLFRDIFYFISGLFICIASAILVDLTKIRALIEGLNTMGIMTIAYLTAAFFCYVLGYAVNEFFLMIGVLRTKYHKPSHIVQRIAGRHMDIKATSLKNPPPEAVDLGSL